MAILQVQEEEIRTKSQSFRYAKIVTFQIHTSLMDDEDAAALTRAYRAVDGWADWDAEGIPVWLVDDQLRVSVSFEPSGLQASIEGTREAVTAWIAQMRDALEANLPAHLIA